jgi:regulator of protease activity HflC (stomatin/prohibitin superfamily)
VIDGHTEPWGTQVTAVEIKDITLAGSRRRYWHVNSTINNFEREPVTLGGKTNGRT